MKIILLSIFTINLAFAIEATDQVHQHGNDNVNNICQPKIVVKNKPVIIYKDKVRYVKGKTVVKKTIVEKIVIKKVKVKADTKKNRVRLIAGVGPTGVSLEKNGNEASLFEENGGVIGIGYDRLLGDTISIGIQGISNETYGISLGLDF